MLRTSLSAKSVLSLALTVLILLTPLCSCEKTEKNNTENHITFTDVLERKISVAKNPKRVATLIGSFADVWLLAGGTVIASADDAWDDFGLDISSAVNIGGAHSPNLELLLSSKPDFVIASASTASNVEMRDTLESANISVAYFDVDSFDDYLKMLDICTDITERKDLYEQNGLKIKNKIDKIKSDIANAKIPDAKRKVLLLRASSGFVKAKGSEGTVLGEMLKDMGCINIADSDKSLLENLSVESVIKSNPYHIFVVTMGNDTLAARENISKIMEENPAWNTLEAVKENRLYFMDRKLFNLKPNARWSQSYEQLYKILQK